MLETMGWISIIPVALAVIFLGISLGIFAVLRSTKVMEAAVIVVVLMSISFLIQGAKDNAIGKQIAKIPQEPPFYGICE